MSAERFRAVRAGIVGASSLLGKDLKTLMEERGFPADEIRLLDDEVAGGTLTEAAGEPTFIQTLEEGSFDRLDFVFFAGQPEFTRRYYPVALRSGARVIDLTGALADTPEAAPWIPSLDAVLPSPAGAPGGGKLFFSPLAASIIACSLAAAVKLLGAKALAIVILQPVSERGQEGIEELESQTVSLLSFQPISRKLYDAQVAFNLLSSFGVESRVPLAAALKAVRTGAARVLDSHWPAPAIQLLQVPVFYSHAFTALATFDGPADAGSLQQALAKCAVAVQRAGHPAPDNVSVAGEAQIHVAIPERHEAENTVWITGAADNVRLAAANALAVAERLIAS